MEAWRGRVEKRDRVLSDDYNRRLPHQPPWNGPGRYVLWMRDRTTHPCRTLACSFDIHDEAEYEAKCAAMRFTIWENWARNPVFNLNSARYEFMPREEIC